MIFVVLLSYAPIGTVITGLPHIRGVILTEQQENNVGAWSINFKLRSEILRASEDETPGSQ